jgi:uncharacterized membrane protein YedE/YeeE
MSLASSQKLERTWIKGFALLAGAMAAFAMWRFVPHDANKTALYDALFVTRWPWWIGGSAIAGVVFLLLFTENQLLGVSGGCGELCVFHRDPTARRSWRLRFLLGIVGGGVLAAVLGGSTATWSMGAFDTIFGSSLSVKLGVLSLAGLFIGAGARLAGGCTSGHGIVGTALGSRASLIATSLFLVAGFATTHFIHLVRG